MLWIDIGWVLAFALTSTTTQDPPPAVDGLTFHVRVEGERPTFPPYDVSKVTHCKEHHPEGIERERLIADANGNLANVLVIVKKGHEALERPEPSEEAVLIDQVNCQYVPHVVVVHTGQKLEIRNSDPILHNVHGIPAVNFPEFNFAQVRKGQATIRKFRKPEIGLFLKCDIHSWMSAWIHVVDHPWYALTGTDGRATVRGLPPGKYTFTVWHEVFRGDRAKTVEVEVKADGNAPVEVVFEMPKRKS